MGQTREVGEMERKREKEQRMVTKKQNRERADEANFPLTVYAQHRDI